MLTPFALKKDGTGYFSFGAEFEPTRGVAAVAPVPTGPGFAVMIGEFVPDALVDKLTFKAVISTHAGLEDANLALCAIHDGLAAEKTWKSSTPRRCRNSPICYEADAYAVTEGVTFYERPGVRAYVLSPAALERLPECLRLPDGVYEIGMQWGMLAADLPELFTPEEFQAALGDLRNHYPAVYGARFGFELTAVDSRKLAYAAWTAENARRLHAHQFHADFLPDIYRIEAHPVGGTLQTPRYFLVPREDVQTSRSRFGFLIDEERHQEISADAKPGDIQPAPRV